MKTLLWIVSAVVYPAFVRAPLRGFSCALRQLALLLRLRRPAGYGFPPNLVRKGRRKDFSGASVNAELRHLGAWPTRSMVPRSRSGDSTNGDNHVPEQSNPHRLPGQQRRSPHQHATAALPLFRSQPSPPTRRTASTSRTPNGTVASSSASSRSSPRRSPRARISRWKASCAAGNTTARRRTPIGASGRFGSLRS